MKVWKMVAMVGVTLALAAPAANATYDRALPTKATNVKVKVANKVKAHPQGKSGKSGKTGTSGKGKSGGGVVIMIISTGPVTNQPPTGTDYDCAISGNNCTDEQNCLIWGMNCDLIGPNAPVAPAVDVAPAAAVSAPAPAPAAVAPVAAVSDQTYGDWTQYT